MSNVVIKEFDMNCATAMEEVVNLEKNTFPNLNGDNESIASFFDDELKRKNSGLLYLHVDGELAGYVMYYLPFFLKAIIIELAVKEEWRRRGHGEALLKAAIEKCRARKVWRIVLHVDPLRTPALNLYKKLGFQVDALIEGYYSSGQNAYAMYLHFFDSS